VRRKEARQDAQAREQLERNQLVVAQESGEMDGWRRRALGAIEGQTAGDGLAYAMRLELQQAYASGTVGRARSRFKSWCRWVRTEAQALASGLLNRCSRRRRWLERHLEGILGHWKQGLTTAFLEGLNSLFSATKRKSSWLSIS